MNGNKFDNVLKTVMKKNNPKSIKLLPCPFCGSEDVFIDDAVKKMKPAFMAICLKCYASSDAQYTKEIAINAWNRRVK